MDDLLLHGHEDIYNVENRIRNSLPKPDKASLVVLR
jgi:hypothetical protein